MNGITEKKLIDLYLSNVEILDEGLSSAIVSQRSAAIEAFNLNGLPEKKNSNDRYRYVDLKDAFSFNAEHYFTPSYTSIEPPQTNPEEYTITVINGFCRNEQPLTTVDNGIVFGSLATAAEAYEDIFAKHYNRTSTARYATTELNTAFVQDGAFVYVPKNITCDRPLRIRFMNYSENEALNTFSRILIIAEQNSNLQIIIEHSSLCSEPFTGCYVNEVVSEEGASVEIAEMFNSSFASTIISDTYIYQGASSSVNSLSASISGKVVCVNSSVALAGQGAENHTNGVLVCREGEHFDFATNIEHQQPNCTSYEHFKVVAAEDGIGAFNGRIYVAPDAQNTQAFQQNNNLLLSDSAHIYTKPQLEIYADNVKCSHGATVGQLDADAVYYMRQRGISEADARRLQMYGFVNEAIELCRIDSIRDYLENLTAQKIDTI